jgi:hypothetical protein
MNQEIAAKIHKVSKINQQRITAANIRFQIQNRPNAE